MYYLYKLTFPNGVHFGADKVGIGLEKNSISCHADTFFSALSIEILNLFGQNDFDEFIEIVKNDDFLLSDLFPFKDEELYLPKPIIYVESESEETPKDSILKKKIKKTDYIPITKLGEYFDYLKTHKNFPEIENDFGENTLINKVQLSRFDNDENSLYSLSVFNFYSNCGLYFIVKTDEANITKFENILKSLSFTGIGGKRSLGYGKFDYEDRIELDEECYVCESDRILSQLVEKTGEYYLSLTSINPKSEELDTIKSGYYSMHKRQGFVYSKDYADTLLKKVPTVMIGAGSCFREKVNGELLDVSNRGNHPVYSYGKPIMIGVNL